MILISLILTACGTDPAEHSDAASMPAATTSSTTTTTVPEATTTTESWADSYVYEATTTTIVEQPEVTTTTVVEQVEVTTTTELDPDFWVEQVNVARKRLWRYGGVASPNDAIAACDSWHSATWVELTEAIGNGLLDRFTLDPTPDQIGTSGADFYLDGTMVPLEIGGDLYPIGTPLHFFCWSPYE